MTDQQSHIIAIRILRISILAIIIFYFYRFWPIPEPLVLAISILTFLFLGTYFTSIRSSESELIYLASIFTVISIPLAIAPIQYAFSLDLLAPDFKDISPKNIEGVPTSITLSLILNSSINIFIILMLILVGSLNLKITAQVLDGRRNNTDCRIDRALMSINKSIKSIVLNATHVIDLTIAIGATLVAIGAFHHIITTPAIDNLRNNLDLISSTRSLDIFYKTARLIYKDYIDLANSMTLIMLETVSAMQIYKTYRKLPAEEIKDKNGLPVSIADKASSHLLNLIQNDKLTVVLIILMALLAAGIAHTLAAGSISTLFPNQINTAPYLSIMIAFFVFIFTIHAAN